MFKVLILFFSIFFVQFINAQTIMLTPQEVYFQQQIHLLHFGNLEERLEAVANLRVFKSALAVRSLITALRGDNFFRSVVNTPVLKYYISQTLADMGQDIAIKPVIEEYKKYESTVAEQDKPFLDEKNEYSLLMALGEMLRSLGSLPHSNESFDVIKTALSHKNYYIRSSAADSLRRANRKEGIEILISALQNEKSDYTKVAILNAILSLEKIPGPYFLQLAGLLKSTEASVRHRASIAFGDLDIKAAEPYLKSALLIEDDLNVRIQLKKDLVVLRGFRIPDIMPGLKY